MSDHPRDARLLFVMNTPATGGAERHTFDLADAITSHGFASTIFAMKAGSLRPRHTKLLQPEVPRTLPARLLDLSRAIRLGEPDVIVAVNERPMFASYLARWGARRPVPIAGISHTTVLRTPREKLLHRVYLPVINRLDGLIYISRNQAEYWTARGMVPRSETVILNGIDTGRFTPRERALHREASRSRLGLSDREIVLGMCAVLRPEKNHRQLVEAVAALRGTGMAAHALIVGDGPMRGAVEQAVSDLGMADHVTFTGMQADVRPLVAAFDVGILTSTAIETLSLSALEVMAMGIPMVMSDLGGASEIIDGSNGRLFPVGDLAALCRCLESLREGETRDEAGRRARDTVTARFDQARMVAEYAAYFRQLAASRGARLPGAGTPSRAAGSPDA